MKLEMKIVPVALVFLLLAIGSYAQSTTTASSQTTQTLQCRDMKSGDFIGPDESIMKDANGRYIVCHVVKPAKSTPQSNSIPQTSVEEQSKSSTVVASAHPQSTPAPGQQAVSVSAFPSSSSEQTQATIYFYRPRRFQGAALKPSVFVDDARVGHLHNGDSFKISVAPGNHSIYSTDKATGMELDAKAGETYYVRIDIKVGFFKGHGGVTLVDPQEGKYEAAQAAHQEANADE